MQGVVIPPCLCNLGVDLKMGWWWASCIMDALLYLKLTVQIPVHALVFYHENVGLTFPSYLTTSKVLIFKLAALYHATSVSSKKHRYQSQHRFEETFFTREVLTDVATTPLKTNLALESNKVYSKNSPKVYYHRLLSQWFTLLTTTIKKLSLLSLFFS